MTILSAYAPVREAGNGAKVDFDFAFKIFSSADLSVGKILNSTEVKTTLTLGVDYTVAINSVTDGGTVTYMVAPTALQDSWIGRSLALTQDQDIPTNGPFREIQMENGLDKSRMIDQEQAEELGRCVKLPDISTGVTPVLPVPVDRRALVWDGVAGAMVSSTYDPDEQAALSAADVVLTHADVVLANAAVAAMAAKATETAWTDYAASSTIVGWSSFTTKKIYTKKIGKTVFVRFALIGTSAATGINFTLPDIALLEGDVMGAMGYTADNSSVKTSPGRWYKEGNTNEVYCYSDMASGAWTSSGTKGVQGEFFYETA